MTIPSTPASADLAKGLTNLSKNFGRRSPYRFSNWNIKNLPNPGTKLPDSAFKKLGRAANFFREGHYTLDQIKEIQKNGKKVKETADRVAKESGNMKKLWDALLDPFKKVGGQGGKAAGGIGSLVATIVGFGGIAAILAIKIKVDELTQEQQDKFNNVAQADLSKAYSLASRGILAARKIKADIKEVKLENQRTRDRVYSLEKLLVPIREKLNNITYEVKVGRKILDAGIAAAKKAANDSLAEGRSFNTKNSNAIKALQTDFNKYINAAKDGFQQKIEATVNTLKKGLADAQTANRQANQSIAKANDAISLQSKVITSLQNAFKALKPATPADTKAITNDVIVRVKEFFNPTINKIPAIEKNVFELKSSNSTLKINLENFKRSQGYIDAALRDRDNSIAGGVTNLATAINQQNDRISQIKNGVVVSPPTELAQAVKLQQTTLEEQKRIVASLGGDLKTFKESVAEHDKKLNQLTTGVNGLNQQNAQLKTDLGKLDKNIKEQREVNIEGNRKLDQMFPLLQLIPAIPGNTANAIKPNIPTVPQIGNEVGKQICNSANGGCMKNALDKNASDINNNSNANKGELLDKLNAANNAGQDAALLEILSRLGDKVPGGLSGKLVDGFKWLQLDRALNILTFAATVHNAAMLSNNLSQTLLGVINNGLQLIGFKDSEGNQLDINTVINSTVEDIVKGLIGSENYAVFTASWTKASRIYQSAANMISSITNMSDVILNGLEVVAGQTAKVGNALRNWRVIGEKAYETFNPQPNLKWGIFSKLQKAQESADFILQVSQVPIDIIQAGTDFNESLAEVTKALKEEPEIPKGLKIEDALQTKAQETVVKESSIAAILNDIDLDPDED
ncbi:hypothetical protein Cylst_2572 [Cylindrospermum stagnale PCC 7417]|uniref:Uncharacterized protein n=1 Tax=Cylindrospermum stagnale PCC 7417 TaxID=56107 RepID=K9WX41_9NOST|nr:hypothetical protein [Cylindrospermum stagnale]AFZ24778.1 hypothetical protein Cylst_2572 [Cylindrospermum stagnale PCC 7417]